MVNIENLISQVEYFLYTRPRLARLDAWLGALIRPFFALYRLIFGADPPLSGHRKKGERTRMRVRMSGVRFQYLAHALKHRRRSLSLDASQPRNWLSRFRSSVPTQVQFESQSQSRIFSLPPEIQIMIFGFALCETERIHVDFTDVAGESERLMHVTSWPCFHEENTKECHFGCLNVREDAPRRRLALLQSCRLAYTTGIPLLYSLPTFAFRDTSHLLLFLHILPSSHIQQIRHLTLEATNFEPEMAFPRPFRISTSPDIVNNPRVEQPDFAPLKNLPGLISTQLPQLRSIFLSFRVYASQTANPWSSVSEHAVRAAEDWFRPLVRKRKGGLDVWFVVDVGVSVRPGFSGPVTVGEDGREMVCGRWPLRRAVLLGVEEECADD